MTNKDALTCAGQPLLAAIARGLAAIALLAIVLPATAAAQEGGPGEFRAYPVSKIALEDAAQRLRAMLAEMGDPFDVLVDSRNGRLLVQGAAPTQQLAAQILQTIDQPAGRPPTAPPPPQVEVKSYPVQGVALELVVGQLKRQFPPSTGVRIATDPRGGQVIVVATAEVQQQVEELLKSISASPEATSPAATPSRPPASSHQLRHTTWQNLEAALQRISGGRFAVSVSGEGNVATFTLPGESGAQEVLQVHRGEGRVDFSGSVEAAAAWRPAVEALDRPGAAPDDQLEVVPVRNADPARIRLAVAALSSESTGDGTSTAITPRPNWGGRLVSAIFQEATQGGGAAAQPGGAPPAGDAGQGGGLIGTVDIQYLEGLDVIIIRGRPSDVAQVQEIINQIEILSLDTQPIVEVYHLQHINGAAAAALVNELYGEILSPRQGLVSIRALVDPNAILLIGRKESVEVVKGLIARLDQPVAPASQFEVFRLKWVSAVDAEQTIRNFFVNRPGVDTEERAGLGTRVQVLADYRSNSLIVQASPRDLEEVRRLIKSIDVDATENLAELKVFRLRNAIAEDLADVLQTAITGPTAGAGAGGAGGQAAAPGQAAAGATQTQASLPSATLQFMLVDDDGTRRMLRSGIVADAQVTADPSINALIVRAPADSMGLFEALITHLDRLPNAEARIKVFEIENGDATSLAGMVQQLFGQQVTVGQGNAQFALGGFAGLGQQQLQAATAGGETSLVPLRIAVDIRTNSIIVSASEGDLNVVEAILKRLDLTDVEARTLEVVRLKNVPALDVANAITSFLTSQRQLIQQQLLFNQAISPYEQIEREIIVVAEPVSNSLIVSAMPRYREQILEVIRDLDFRPKMVVIQVLIAQVALSDLFEFGVEFGLQDSLLFDRGIVLNSAGGIPPNTPSIPGFNFNNITTNLPNLNTLGRDSLAAQGLTNFGVGRANGGLVFSAASESINILLRALQEKGQAQALARPQIMTLHNQEAFVQVGQTISRITGTTITGTGIVQNNVADVQTGLILTVHPLINDDGVVVMSVEAERSRLGSELEGTIVAIDQNGQPIRSPPIDITTASTIVNAKSGQTVVFAGLITSDKLLTVRRVPWISDIPVLGRLFEFEDRLERRSELLIVMTPHIVESDEDYEWIKAVESDRMSWCLSDIVNMHGDVGLLGNNPLFCCDYLPVIYPHVNPIGIDNPSLSTDPITPLTEFPPQHGASFEHDPVIPEVEPNPQVSPAESALLLPVAPGYETTVTYGPPPPGYWMPSFQQPHVQDENSDMRSAARFNRLPEVR